MPVTPKVSICIPTYNRRSYLKEALDSALVQTYQDREVVVVDDGSTDGTDEVVKDYGPDLRYYRVDHIGQAAARNELIERARGEYLTFLDSDDALFPDAVEKLMRVMAENGPDVFVYGYYVGMDEHGEVLPRRQPRLPSGNITADLFDFLYVKSCGTLCARSIYRAHGGFDASMPRCAVYKLLLQFSLTLPFLPVEGPMYKKRRHRENMLDRQLAGRLAELEVLEDFYQNGGGRAVIPHRIAARRLGQEAYRVGRCAQREGQSGMARTYFARSWRMHPNLKALLHWGRESLRRRTGSTPGRPE